EAALVMTEPLKKDITGNQFVVFQVKDVDKAKEQLAAIEQKVNGDSANTDEQTRQLMMQLNFSHLFGKPFISLHQPYYQFLNDYLVFGEPLTGMNEFYKSFAVEKTLANDENFQSFSDQLSSSSAIFVYNNIARSVHWYKTFIKEEVAPDIDEHIEFMRKFEAVAFQVSPQKDQLFYNNIYFKYNPVYKQDTRTLWEALLDTSLAIDPEIVMNHQTQTKEVFVQDNNNKIYLISTTGKVLWTKIIDEKIIGEVHQIDAFKNNKLQLLFSTK